MISHKLGIVKLLWAMIQKAENKELSRIKWTELPAQWVSFLEDDIFK
jgi:hypothetical protein